MPRRATLDAIGAVPRQARSLWSHQALKTPDYDSNEITTFNPQPFKEAQEQNLPPALIEDDVRATHEATASPNLPTTLTTLGWSDALEAERHHLNEPGSPGRVVCEQRGAYEVLMEDGERLHASLPGGERWSDPLEKPAVGDWLHVERFEGLALVRHRYARHSRLVRKAAGRQAVPQVVGANLDVVFLVTSLNQELNLRRLERYLATIWSSGASPVVVLTKADLCDDVSTHVSAVAAVTGDVPVHIVSAVADQNRGALLAYMGAGRTVGLVGSSGVGKSTLANWLCAEERQVVQSIREHDAHGRHTTTHRHLMILPDALGLLMDTPGMRELGVWDAEEGIERVFADIEALTHDCRFRDCTHQSEPGCGVLAALDEGNISLERWRSYQKLKRENAWLAARGDMRVEHQQRKARRRFSRMVRRTMRDKNKR